MASSVAAIGRCHCHPGVGGADQSCAFVAHAQPKVVVPRLQVDGLLAGEALLHHLVERFRLQRGLYRVSSPRTSLPFLEKPGLYTPPPRAPVRLLIFQSSQHVVSTPKFTRTVLGAFSSGGITRALNGSALEMGESGFRAAQTQRLAASGFYPRMMRDQPRNIPCGIAPLRRTSYLHLNLAELPIPVFIFRIVSQRVIP